MAVRRIGGFVNRGSWVLAVCVAAYGALAFGAAKPVNTTKPTKGVAVKPAPAAPVPVVHRNPLLPAPVGVEAFYVDLGLVQKTPATGMAGFAPLYTAEDWQLYRDRLGVEADEVTKLKVSGQLEFANKLIGAAEAAPTEGTRRLALIRAVAIAYRSEEGFAVADRAVGAYMEGMDRNSAMQMGALWTMANAISRMAVTPKPDRIRYDGIAAKANMQLALLLLKVDQIEPAQAMVKQLGYHEAWLAKAGASEALTRTHIAQVRVLVRQHDAMMDYLATLYEPAIRSEDAALMTVYLYGRYVKENVGLVADLPGRKPESALAQLVASLEAAERDPAAAFVAAENLRIVASTQSDPLIKDRTLYAALQEYRAFLNSKETERDRVKRTLARMALEAVIADGARGPMVLDVFAAPAAPATRPATHVVATE